MSEKLRIITGARFPRPLSYSEEAGPIDLNYSLLPERLSLFSRYLVRHVASELGTGKVSVDKLKLNVYEYIGNTRPFRYISEYFHECSIVSN